MKASVEFKKKEIGRYAPFTLQRFYVTISTRNLSALPSIDNLRRLMQSLAMLDAILCAEWQYRYYSFNAQWSDEAQMGSMRNGSGDEFYALFNDRGCFLKGFDHESIMTPYQFTPKKVWQGVLDHVPDDFHSGLTEPAFSMGDTTYCIWRCYSDLAWLRGAINFPVHSDPDGSEWQLAILDGKAETYQHWAESYYEQTVDIAAVRNIYAHQALTAELVAILNPKLTLSELQVDISQIAYPNAG